MWVWMSVGEGENRTDKTDKLTERNTMLICMPFTEVDNGWRAAALHIPMGKQSAPTT